jgi:hypothetical protein
MEDVLALQDLEPASAAPRTGGMCCISNWASISNLTVEIQ